ncbi:MAG: hypothetical protein A2189_03285 [Paenibacillus sp. RIFOXYA1_FULL_44_5]|nr:MAG: hypothetical protein A2189_03285 [Paenibacillus sp. RIFOXYA1_FULL_44_5]
MIRLSKRLQQIANLVPKHGKLADIGSDHALLPTYLIQLGKIDYAVAGEVNAGPFAAAQKQIKEAGVSAQVSVRQGNGLEVVEAGEIDVVIIAGMGGSLITDILEAGLEKLIGVKRLILQPNVAEERVRRWLNQHHWFVEEEYIVEEDGQIYEIISAVRMDNRFSDQYQVETIQDCEISADLKFMFGPILIHKADDVFFEKWKQEMKKIERVIEQLRNSELQSSLDKQMIFREQKEQVEEVLDCLQKVKP